MKDTLYISGVPNEFSLCTRACILLLSDADVGLEPKPGEGERKFSLKEDATLVRCQNILHVAQWNQPNGNCKLIWESDIVSFKYFCSIFCPPLLCLLLAEMFPTTGKRKKQIKKSGETTANLCLVCIYICVCVSKISYIEFVTEMQQQYAATKSYKTRPILLWLCTRSLAISFGAKYEEVW